MQVGHVQEWPTGREPEGNADLPVLGENPEIIGK